MNATDIVEKDVRAGHGRYISLQLAEGNLAAEKNKLEGAMTKALTVGKKVAIT